MGGYIGHLKKQEWGSHVLVLLLAPLTHISSDLGTLQSLYWLVWLVVFHRPFGSFRVSSCALVLCLTWLPQHRQHLCVQLITLHYLWFPRAPKANWTFEWPAIRCACCQFSCKQHATAFCFFSRSAVLRRKFTCSLWFYLWAVHFSHIRPWALIVVILLHG